VSSSIRVLIALLVAWLVPASARTQTVGDVVLHPGEIASVRGNWSPVSDNTAAGGIRLDNSDRGDPKLTAPLAVPTDYFEVQFQASAGIGYRLWIRGKASGNNWENDSVYVQFSDSVSSTRSATFRIGSTSATVYSIEDCSGCGLSDWGWNDNYYGSDSGPLIYFAESGTHTIRVQRREDGISIDQIVLSPSTYSTEAPGGAKNDTTIVSSEALPASTTTSNLPPVFEADPDGFRISQFDPSLPVAPVSAYFTAAATGPESGDTLTFVWNFGDGSPTVTTQQSSEFSRHNVVHTYTAAGTYTAKVTVRDQANNATTRSRTITVGASAAMSTGEALKVLQWNTYKGRTTDTRTEGSKIWLFARWMAGVHPHVILLQEVMGTYHADRYKSALEAAMPGTTWSYVYRSDSNTVSSTAQGIAILSRLPILSHASIAYAPCPAAQIGQRAAIAITVSVNGRNVTLFDTHLSSYSGDADYDCRFQQAKQLRAWAASFEQPRIITGDLNETADKPAVQYLLDSYEDTWRIALGAARATGYPDNPANSIHTRGSRIDFVLHSGSTLGVLAAQVPDTRDFTNDNAIASQALTSWAPHNKAPRASDHEMMIVRFVVK
jgi:endonuclease/exonuclease/phosphatase family metal-dependent hydrolase